MVDSAVAAPATRDRRTVLVLNVNNSVGRSVLGLLAPYRDRLRVVGLSRDPLSPFNFECDATYYDPGRSPRASLGRTVEVMRAERAVVVVAGSDGDVRMVAALAADPAHAGTLFLGPRGRAAVVATDKIETFRFAREHRLPFADTVADRDGAARLIARHGLPLIAKPRRGAGSAGVWIAQSAADVEALMAQPDMILQQFLARPAALPTLPAPTAVPLTTNSTWQAHYSVQTVVSAEGEALSVFAGRQVFSRGWTVGLNPTREPAIDAGARAWAKALAPLGFIGPLNIEGHLVDGRFVAFEINGRFTDCSLERALLGFDDVAIAFEHFVFGNPQPLDRALDLDHYVFRGLKGWRLSRADVETLRRGDVWTPAE